MEPLPHCVKLENVVDVPRRLAQKDTFITTDGTHCLLGTYANGIGANITPPCHVYSMSDNKKCAGIYPCVNATTKSLLQNPNKFITIVMTDDDNHYLYCLSINMENNIVSYCFEVFDFDSPNSCLVTISYHMDDEVIKESHNYHLKYLPLRNILL